jgi:hypothetical protein
MKTLANRLVMFAASAVVLGTMAYGQPQMKAEVPFAFSAGSATLPSGSYLVYRQSLGAVTKMMLEDTVSHRSFFAVGAYVDSRDRPSQLSVVFACLNGACSLSAIKMDNGTLKFAPPRNAARVRGTASIVSIPLTSRNVD